MSRLQSHQASINNTYSIEMLHRYPFETAVPQNYNAVVRMTRRFHDLQYESLRLKVESHSQLRHPTLIRIMRATVNRNARHFNIYYEYVSHNLRNKISNLTLKQIRDNQLRLFDLCDQLMNINIYPEVAEELLGITQNGIIKLYMDVDYRELTGKENKQDLLMAKQIEINSIFNKYLSQVPSIKALKHYKSAPSIKGYSNTTIPFSPMAKKSMARDSQLLRESEVIETANYMHIPRASIRNSQPIMDESLVHYTGPNEQTFSRQQMARRYADSQVPTTHEAYENRYRRQVEHAGHQYAPHHMPMGDHESHSTYHEEMGEVIQMPKIKVTGLRQTAPTSKLQNKMTLPQQHRLNEREIYEQGYDQGQKVFAKQKAIGGGHSKRPTAVSSSQIQSQQRNWTPQAANSTVKPFRKPEISQPQTKHPDNNHYGYWQAMNNALSKEYHHQQQQVEAQQQQQQQPQQNAEPQPEVEQVKQSRSKRQQNNQKLQTRPTNEYVCMDSDDPLTKEFNNLFDSHHENQQAEQPQPQPRESIRANPRQSVHKGSEAQSEKNLINQRVQKALEKSRSMLNYFYANNPQKQPCDN